MLEEKQKEFERLQANYFQLGLTKYFELGGIFFQVSVTHKTKFICKTCLN